MKKIFLMAACALFSAASFAQGEVGSLLVRAKAGLNVADITDVSTNPRLGLVVGAEAEYQVTDIFSVTAGALYSVQGATSKAFNKDIDALADKSKTITVKLDYINFPIIANVYVMDNLAVKLGIQPALNIKGRHDWDDYSKVNHSKTLDFAIPIGVSYNYEDFVFDARYNFGVSKIFDNYDSHNTVFQFTVGYNLPL